MEHLKRCSKNTDFKPSLWNHGVITHHTTDYTCTGSPNNKKHSPATSPSSPSIFPHRHRTTLPPPMRPRHLWHLGRCLLPGIAAPSLARRRRLHTPPCLPRHRLGLQGPAPPRAMATPGLLAMPRWNAGPHPSHHGYRSRDGCCWLGARR
ncbi:hypothetical protein SEVIR_3G330345v4 [Setaria viridis]